MTTYEGRLNGSGLKFGLVVGRFNELISTRLYEGALDCLRRHDVADGDVDAAWVPGAFEMPLVQLDADPLMLPVAGGVSIRTLLMSGLVLIGPL